MENEQSLQSFSVDFATTTVVDTELDSHAEEEAPLEVEPVVQFDEPSEDEFKLKDDVVIADDPESKLEAVIPGLHVTETDGEVEEQDSPEVIAVGDSEFVAVGEGEFFVNADTPTPDPDGLEKECPISDLANFVPAPNILLNQSHLEQARKFQDAKPDLVGYVMITGVESGDGRYIYPDALIKADGSFNIRPGLSPFMYMPSTGVGGHSGAVQVGVNLKVELHDLGDGTYGVWAETKINENSEYGQEVLDGYANGFLKSVSGDIDRVKFGIKEVDGAQYYEIIKARFMGMTVVSFPALENAGMWRVAQMGEPVVAPAYSEDDESALVASGQELYLPQVQIFTEFNVKA